MGKPIQTASIDNTAVLASNTSESLSPTSQVNTRMRVGPYLYRSARLRVSGDLNLTTSAAGTIVVGGGLDFVKGVSFGTDKHNLIIDNVDGRGLARINHMKNNSSAFLAASDISAATTGTPTFDYVVPLDFSDYGSIRPLDLAVQAITARPYLNVQYGSTLANTTQGPFITGGTYSAGNAPVRNLNQELEADLEVDPDLSKDAPLFMPHLEVRRYAITQTTRGYAIQLPYNDRIYRRMWISQRNSSTLAELANTVMSTADSDRMTVKVNGYTWLDNVQCLAHQKRNALDLGITSMPTGWMLIDFAKKQAGGYKLSDSLSVVDANAGTIELDIDVTSVSNGALWVYLESAKPMPAAAALAVPSAK